MNIKNACLHVLIFPPHQRFLRFEVEKHHFQFVALLLSLSMASCGPGSESGPSIGPGFSNYRNLKDLPVIEQSALLSDYDVSHTVHSWERFPNFDVTTGSSVGISGPVPWILRKQK